MTPINIEQTNVNDDTVIIVNILKKDLDKVKKKELLFEVESSKAVVEVESPQSGILKIIKNIRDEIKVGETIGYKIIVMGDQIRNQAKKRGLSNNAETLSKLMIDIQNNAHKIAELMLEKKAGDIKIIDVRKITTLTDFFVLCTSGSAPQTHAITDYISQKMKKKGGAGIEPGTF